MSSAVGSRRRARRSRRSTARCGSRTTAPNSSLKPSTCHGGSTSSTSCPSERSSSAASATARAQIGSTTASATGGSVVVAIRSARRDRHRGARCALRGRGERLGRRRRPGGVAGLIAGEHVKDRRSVGDRAREDPVDRQRASRPSPGATRCARGWASDPPGRSRPRESGSSRRRRCRGPPAPCRPRPRPPRRRRSRRGCAPNPRGCGSGRTGAPRWSGRIPYSGRVVVPTITNPASFRRRTSCGRGRPRGRPSASSRR